MSFFQDVKIVNIILLGSFGKESDTQIMMQLIYILLSINWQNIRKNTVHLMFLIFWAEATLMLDYQFINSNSIFIYIDKPESNWSNYSLATSINMLKYFFNKVNRLQVRRMGFNIGVLIIAEILASIIIDIISNM